MIVHCKEIIHQNVFQTLIRVMINCFAKHFGVSQKNPIFLGIK